MNPFLFGSVVKGDCFFDREEISKQIIDTLGGGNNIVLYAPRRFGKTSMVFNIIEQMEKQGFICIYFDFMSIYSVESFIRSYTKVIASKQSNIQKFTQTLASIFKGIRPSFTVSADGKTELSLDFEGSKIDEIGISQLLDMTETLGSSKKRVLVFFDEFQEVIKLEGLNFENLLRSKIQQQGNTNYLFFGSKTHLLNEIFNDKRRAFYESSAQMTLGPLPEKETISFLQKKFKKSSLELDKDSARYLIDTAGNIPHYIQFLASEVWQQLVGSSKKITKAVIDSCAERVIAHKSDYYMELFDRQSSSKKQFLQALTRGGKNIFSTEYMRAAGFKTMSTMQRAVYDLIADGTVEKADGEYFIADPFFKRFVQTTM
ncbi:ATPase [Spirochaetia bacterium]|nr:ATPase [Spirochaetia bacterium]